MKSGELRLYICLFFLLVTSLQHVRGQRSAAYYLRADHHEALELFDKEKYAAAQSAFDRVIERHGPNDLIRIAAEYYSARCAMELYNRDAVEKMQNFVEGHPDSPWLTEANYQLGRYHYQEDHYDEAIARFKELDIKELSEERKNEVRYKTGHAHFKEEQFKKASEAFYKIKDEEHAYYGPTNYYFAHINYRQKNYQTALEHFLRIKDHPNFKRIVPYYLTQIHFLQDNYERVVEMAPPFLDSAGTERPTEIARIIGESYYRTERYKKAIPYLQRYMENAYGVNREDRYQLGFAMMKAGKGERALEQFEKVVSRDDSLAQIAYYHMGEINLKNGKKRKAQSAYRSASWIEKNERIREDALFKFAKLSYELSFDPFDQAIRALKTYIDAYPDSDRKEKALEYLSELYMSSRDLDAALASMERIEDKSLRIRTAYQTVAYDKAVSLYLEDRYPRAIELFKKARIYPVDQAIKAKSLYWQAQCYAEMSRKEQALATYEEFRKAPGAFSMPWYARSYYDAGYLLFRDSAYKEAATEFRKFVDAADHENFKEEIADAYQRTGDAYYLIKDYKRAIRFYKKASGMEKVKGRDRALYQTAVCQGLMGELEKKISTLHKLLKEHHGSEFIPQAKLALGRASVKTGRKEKALKIFNSLIEKGPESFEAQKARLQAGLILYQKGRDQQALDHFKKVVESGVSYELSKEAVNRMRDVHVEAGTMESYNEYVSGLEGFKVDAKEMDEANYRSAENLYLDERYEKAAKAFEQYLKKFDPANYATNARFYLAQSLLRTGDTTQALEAYEKVIAKGPNRFIVPALEKASELTFARKERKKALDHFRELEAKSNSGELTRKARLGQMRCLSSLKKDSAAAIAADSVLALSEISEKERVEALMIKGRFLQDQKAFKKARSIFQKVVDTTSSEAKAEARYRIAATHFAEEDHKKTEKVIYDLVHQKPSYKEWVAKGFLLLAKAYQGMDDRYQAKETLKSLIDLYDGKSIVKKAEQELEKIRERERKEEKMQQKRTDSSKVDSPGKRIRIEPDSLQDR